MRTGYQAHQRGRDERHRYGQHYTPPGVARLLAAFAVRSAADVVFDPACGDGRLLEQVLEAKKNLARRRGVNAGGEVFGLDRSAEAVAAAAATGARVVAADFFDVEPAARLDGSFEMPADFDAVIGNPPYIRQEVLGPRDKGRIRRRLKQGCLKSPEIYWPRWSGRSDMYVYFFAHAARFVREGGRLVFLTAGSWLDAGYGAALREFLLKNFRIIAILESAAESFFQGASINTAVAVLARESDAPAREANPVRFVQLTMPLGEILKRGTALDLARSIERAAASVSSNTHNVRVVEQAELSEDSGGAAGWGKYLRADEVFFRVIERGSARLRRLSDMARVRFGVKTGANEFFYVKGAGERSGKNGRGTMRRLANMAIVRRGLMTGANDFFYLKAVEAGSAPKRGKRPTPSATPVEDRSGARHLIESAFLSPVIFSLKEIPAILLERKGNEKLFFNCSLTRGDLKKTRALDYVRSGERAGFHLRPTCAARDPWYSVARAMRPAPLIFPSKVGERWLVALNRARVFEDKKLYGIFPLKKVSKLTLAALLNSTWARYYAEVTCRQMTGAQAIADIDVVVAGHILLPDPRRLSPAMCEKLESALKRMARRPVLSVFEEIKQADRRRLDELALAAIGFTERAERKAVLDQLYAAVVNLVRARLNKSYDL